MSNIYEQPEFEKIRSAAFRTSLKGRSSTEAIPIFLKTWQNAKCSDEYWYCLIEIFLGADYFKSYSAELHKHFQGDYCKWEGTSALLTMIPDDRNKFEELPDIVSIYRGIGLSDFDQDSVAGLSWSTDRDKANEFAEQAADGFPEQMATLNEFGSDSSQDDAAKGIGILVEAKILKKHILYYAYHALEDEVVPDVRHIFDVSYAGWKPSKTNRNRKLEQSVKDDLKAKLKIWFPKSS